MNRDELEKLPSIENRGQTDHYTVPARAREWDVMWVSHLCGSGRYVGFVPGRRGVHSEPAL